MASNIACLSHVNTLFHCFNKLEETKDFYTMVFMKHSSFTHTIDVLEHILESCVWCFDPIVFDVTFRQHTVMFGLFWTIGYDEHSLIS